METKQQYSADHHNKQEPQRVKPVGDKTRLDGFKYDDGQKNYGRKPKNNRQSR